MKLKILGRIALAMAASAGCILGITSCSSNFTVGYLYVTGAQFNQIAGFKIGHNNGSLALIPQAPIGSGGVAPIQSVKSANGRFLYVLNQGCGDTGQAACPSSAGQIAASNISLFAIGGFGVLTFQQSYAMQGRNTLAMTMNPNGTFLYALDALAPDGSGQGDISAFLIDPNTGRLQAITNAQSKGADGINLPYFKVGTNPTWITLGAGGGFVYVAEQGPAVGATPQDPNQAIFVYGVTTSNGQLTLTQNAPLPTGATRLTFINAGSASFVYALDAGPPGSNGFILPYTTGTNGGLQSVTGGAVPNNAQGGQAVNPTNIVTDNSNKFVYVVNFGPNLGTNSPASSITEYVLQTNGQLTPQAIGNQIFGTGSGPRCVLEDPSNQYLYTVNFNDSTMTGKVIDHNAGSLTPVSGPLAAAPGNPTWCVATGNTF
jgi:6-phosphogluconolactonase (cycloisomerase 2 family)